MKNTGIPVEVLREIFSREEPRNYDTSLDQRLFNFVMELDAIDSGLNHEDRLAHNSCQCKACKSPYPEKLSGLSGSYCPRCYMEMTFDLKPGDAERINRIPDMPVVSMKLHERRYDGLKTPKRRDDEGLGGLTPAFI